MDKAEFDKFAVEYEAMHTRNVRVSGESPDFFAEYKISDLAEALVGTQKPRAILDFGAGIGTSVPFVRRYFPGAALTCLDVSDRSLAIARERYPDAAEFVSFDGRAMPFEDGAFDLAYAACVFHHIDAAAHGALMREILRVLRPGGWLFVFEHNPLNPLTRHAVNTCPFDENAVLIGGPRMRRGLIAAGFRDVRLTYRLFFPRILSALRPIERALNWLPLGAQYHVRGRKAGPG